MNVYRFGVTEHFLFDLKRPSEVALILHPLVLVFVDIQEHAFLLWCISRGRVRQSAEGARLSPHLLFQSRLSAVPTEAGMAADGASVLSPEPNCLVKGP